MLSAEALPSHCRPHPNANTFISSPHRHRPRLEAGTLEAIHPASADGDGWGGATQDKPPTLKDAGSEVMARIYLVLNTSYGSESFKDFYSLRLPSIALIQRYRQK